MLPAANAEELKADLDDVLAAIGAQDCSAAQDAIAQAEADLGALPSGTSVRLQEELRRGLDTLSEQAAEECEPTQTNTTPAETTTPTTVETVPTTTETVPHVDTTTVPPPAETTPTVPPETTPTTPPDTSTTGGVEVVP